MRSELVWNLDEFRNLFMLAALLPLTLQFMESFTPHWCLRPQAPDAFRLNPPSQLVIGYRWLGFLNQVRKNV